jgi:hypothetical protein
MIDRSETAESKLPQLPNDPIENADSADPIDAIDSTDPTLPMDSTEPLEAMLKIESVDRMDQRELFPSDTAAASPHPILERPGPQASTAATAPEAKASSSAPPRFSTACANGTDHVRGVRVRS